MYKICSPPPPKKKKKYKKKKKKKKKKKINNKKQMNNLDSKIEYGITLKPTQKEFKNFRKYIFKLFEKKEYQNVGVIKVN